MHPSRWPQVPTISKHKYGPDRLQNLRWRISKEKRPFQYSIEGVEEGLALYNPVKSSIGRKYNSSGRPAGHCAARDGRMQCWFHRLASACKSHRKTSMKQCRASSTSCLLLGTRRPPLSMSSNRSVHPCAKLLLKRLQKLSIYGLEGDVP